MDAPSQMIGRENHQASASSVAIPYILSHPAMTPNPKNTASPTYSAVAAVIRDGQERPAFSFLCVCTESLHVARVGAVVRCQPKMESQGALRVESIIRVDSRDDLWQPMHVATALICPNEGSVAINYAVLSWSQNTYEIPCKAVVYVPSSRLHDYFVYLFVNLDNPERYRPVGRLLDTCEGASSQYAVTFEHDNHLETTAWWFSFVVAKVGALTQAGLPDF